MRGRKAAFRWRTAVLAAMLLVLAVDHGGAFQNSKAPDPNSPKILPRQTSRLDSASVLLTEEERAWLREHPVIRVAQDPGWPPVEFADERGEPSGIANDYLKLVEERLGVTFERVRGLSWQESYARLKRWELDMTTSVTATPEREAIWAFTRPYMKAPIVILTRADVPYIAGMPELAGKKVAVVDGYIAAESIPRDFPEIRLIKVGSVREGIDLLGKDEVFAFVDNMLVTGYYQAKLKLAGLKVAGETPYVNAQSMAVRKDWPILAEILQKALDTISETEAAAIYQKWVPVRYEYGFDYGLLRKMLVLFAAILIGLILWNQKLSREVSSRRKAEDKLRRSERNLAEAERIGQTGSWDYDVASDTAAWSENMFRIFDVDPATPTELVFKHFVDNLVHPEDRSRVFSVLQEALAGTRPYDLEYRIVKKSGSLRDIHAIAQTIRDEYGKPIRLIGKIEDITERKRAEDVLREREQHLSSIYDTVGDIIFHLAVEPGEQYRFISINRSFSAVTGLKPEQVVGKKVSEIIPEPSLTMVLANYRRAIEGKTVALWQETSNYPTGQLIGEVSVAPVFDDQGRCTHLVGSVHDVTERTRAEEALKASEEKFRMITEQTSDLIALTDADGVVVYASPASRGLFQCAPEEMCGRRFTEFLAEPAIPKALAAFRNTLVGDMRTKDLVLTMKRKDDSEFVGEVNGSNFRYGQKEGTLVVIRDITARQQADAAIQASLREKDLLLREIHHRVKNNMQVISSLFNLQAGYVMDENALRILKEGQLRIRSMALVHEKLYQSRDLSKIDFSSYIESLTAHLFQFFRVDGSRIRLETDMENVQLDINSAVPCGLLVNELISNALKHAFPGGRKGTVRVRLRREKDGALVLRIADDGVGLPEGLDFRRVPSFGLQIVDLLVGQLEAAIDLDRTAGTAFTVTFREVKYTNRIPTDS
jgi:PAS domain S-box-containing protein